ncbi:hypothetical protein [Sphingomonas oryzagri]
MTCLSALHIPASSVMGASIRTPISRANDMAAAKAVAAGLAAQQAHADQTHALQRRRASMG